jgi:hypothetical protein
MRGCRCSSTNTNGSNLNTNANNTNNGINESDEEYNEKCSKHAADKRPRDWLTTWNTVVRSWQCLSAAVVYGCFVVLRSRERAGRIPEGFPIRVIEGLVSFIIIIIYWHREREGGG